MNEPIRIALAADDNFAPYLAVTIASITQSAAKDDVHEFYILDGGISSESQKRLREIVLTPGSSLTFVSLADTNLKEMPNISYFSVNTFSRLFLPELLLHVDRILYIDCDLIVRCSLKSLWETSLSNKSLGVIPETTDRGLDYDRYLEKLGKKFFYFNAGVLLINLKKVREENLFQKCLDFIRDNPEKLNYADQDALNAVFDDDTVELPRRWNANPTQRGLRVLLRRKAEQPDLSVEINEALYDPAIVHYVTSSKPWMFMYMGRFKREYWSVLKTTPWAEYRSSDVSVVGAMKKPLIWLRDRLFWLATVVRIRLPFLARFKR